MFNGFYRCLCVEVCVWGGGGGREILIQVLQSNFNGSTTIGTMEISSRQG